MTYSMQLAIVGGKRVPLKESAFTKEMLIVYEFCKRYWLWNQSESDKILQIGFRLRYKEINHCTALRKLDDWRMVNLCYLPCGFEEKLDYLIQKLCPRIIMDYGKKYDSGYTYQNSH